MRPHPCAATNSESHPAFDVRCMLVGILPRDCAPPLAYEPAAPNDEKRAMGLSKNMTFLYINLRSGNKRMAMIRCGLNVGEMS